MTTSPLTSTFTTTTSTRMILTHADDDDDHHHENDQQQTDVQEPKVQGPTLLQRTQPFRTLLTTCASLVIVMGLMMVLVGCLASSSRSEPSLLLSASSNAFQKQARNETSASFLDGTAQLLRRKTPSANTTTTTPTTSTTIEITPLNDTNDTHAAAMAQRFLTSMCGKDSSTVGYCKIQGTIGIVAATQLYQTFCPPWNIYVGTQSFLTQEMCVTHAGGFGGVFETVLTCNGKTSTVYGGFGNLPQSTPSLDGGAVTFPYAGSGYEAQQVVGSTGSCTQDYTLGMYCPIAEVPCYVFAAWQTSTCGGAPVQVCG
jgi:hypothetical protein